MNNALNTFLAWYCGKPWYMRISMSILAVTATYVLFTWIG